LPDKIFRKRIIMDAKSDREFLKAKGAPPHVIERGLAGLIEDWEKVVASIGQGYASGLDDYLNDLDVRQLLGETMQVVSEGERQKFQERLKKADARMRSLTKPIPRCLWGEKVAKEEGWSREKNWWYYAQPLRADQELLEEIEKL
jgi:hypothetical protein